jgi:transposase-like protein
MAQIWPKCGNLGIYNVSKISYNVINILHVEVEAMEFIKECPVCHSDMLLQSAIDPETNEKKNQYVCCNCGKTEDYTHEQ